MGCRTMDGLQNPKLSQYDKASILFAILYPIVPAYFKIGVSFTYIAYIFIIICSFIMLRRKLFLQLNLTSFCLFFWVIVNVMLYFIHGYFIGAFWTILLAIAVIVFSVNIKNGYVFQKIILGICYATGFVCILGIIESITGINVWSFLNNSGETIMYNDLRFGMTRIVSFTYQTITYCTYLVLASALVFYAISFSGNYGKPVKRNLKIIYVLVCINVALTLSRSAILVFIIQQLFLLYKMGFVKLIKRLLQLSCTIILILFLVSLVNPYFFIRIRNLFYMLLAVFDNSYTKVIAEDFGNDNLEAVGTRLLIYKWVYEKVRDNLFMGVGYNTPFLYTFTAKSGVYDYIATKKTIEVEYLFTLYRSGILGLVAEIVALVSIPIMGIKKRFFCADWENKLSFNYVISVSFVCLSIQYFFVNQSSEQNLLYLMVALFLSYNYHHKFTK